MRNITQCSEATAFRPVADDAKNEAPELAPRFDIYWQVNNDESHMLGGHSVGTPSTVHAIPNGPELVHGVVNLTR